MELTTCLWFNGRAREAANFYTSIFPDSSVQDNWIAPTDTPGNLEGQEIVVNFKISWHLRDENLTPTGYKYLLD